MLEREGKIAVDGHHVWYRRVGETQTPLLVLHGGPGAGHDYMEPLEAMAEDREVIFYDQLGCGKSDQPDDLSLWRMDRFVREVDKVRDSLGLERIHLLGHSWGGWLAIEYMLSKPEGVVGLILSSTSASIPQFVSEASKLKAALPQNVYQTMQRFEASGEFHHPEYEAACLEFYKRHLCRLDPWPESLVRSIESLNGNPVYETMNGPNEFMVIGNIKAWDRTDRLSEIMLPALITVGRFDEVPLSCAETIHHGIPNSRLKIFEQSAHCPHLEEPEAFMEVITDYLDQVESIHGQLRTDEVKR